MKGEALAGFGDRLRFVDHEPCDGDGFFVGQMMKQTGGSADPAVVNVVLRRVLDAGAAAPDLPPGAPVK